MTVRWRTRPEAGTYAGDVALSASDGLSTKLVAPPDARYAQVVVTVVK